MDTSNMEEAPVCGFCKEGSSVDDICGKLHVEKIGGKKMIAAHHKCMQYSALLVQYKFDHFGGFKIDKVQREIARGKKVVCAICRKNKSRKGKTNGATSGCAIRSCRKSFHYYCAKLDPVAVTKRMLVRYKNENKEVVLYRVFCGEAHREQFKENKDDFIAPNDKEDNSEESGLDKDEDSNTDGNSCNEMNNDVEKNGEETVLKVNPKLESNTDDISLCTIGSPDNRSLLSDKQFSNQGFTPFQDVSCIDHHKGEGDSLLVRSADKMDKVVSSTPIVSIVDKVNGDNSESKDVYVKKVGKATKESSSDSKIANNHKKRSQTAKSMTISKTLFSGKLQDNKNKSLSLSKNKQKRNSSDSPSLPKRVLDVKDQHNGTASSSETDTESITAVNERHPNYALIIVDKLDESKQDALKQEVANSVKTYGIAAANCILWSSLFDSSGIPDFEKKVPHLMSDLITLLKEKDFVKVVQLLLDSEKMKNHLHNHNYVLNLESVVSQEILKSMVKSLFDSIEKGLTEASMICGYNVGKLMYPKCSPDTKALVLVVNDIFDNKSKMRSRFSEFCLETAYRLSNDILLSGKDAVKSDVECEILQKLIINSTSDKFQLSGVPENQFLLADNQEKESQKKNKKSNAGKSVVLKLEKKLGDCETKRKIKISNNVICIRNVDSRIVDYQGLCHKIIEHVTTDNKMRTKNHFIVMDITGSEFKTVDDIVPVEIRNCNPDLAVYTAFKPDQKRVSCAVVEIKCQPVASGSGHASHQKRQDEKVSSGSGTNGSIVHESSSTSSLDDDDTDSVSSAIGRQSLRSSMENWHSSPQKSTSSPHGSKPSSPVKSLPSAEKLKLGRSSPRYLQTSQATSPARQSLKRPSEAESPSRQSKFVKKS